MRNKKIGFLLFAGIGTACFFWALLPSTYPFSFAGDEKGAHDWVTSALPLGSARDDVEKWLGTEGLAISQIVDQEGHSVGIIGEKPYTTWNGTWGVVVLELYFGRDGKLSERVVYLDVASL